MPHLFLLAGPNGAGKSTSAPQILSGPRGVDEFVNADVIQKEEGVSEIEAGRRTLARLDALAAQRRNIAFETTLSSRGLLPRIRELQAAGYLCHLVFCWLPSADMAVQRVAHRVVAGGHYLSVVDSWRLLNNTLAPPRLIAWRDVAKSLKILDHRIWTTLSATYMKPRVEQTQSQLTQDDLGWNSEDILQAMNVAVTEALRRHKARGESVVVWRDGKVVVLKPEEIDV